MDVQRLLGNGDQKEHVATHFHFLNTSVMNVEGGEIRIDVDGLIGPRVANYFSCRGA